MPLPIAWMGSLTSALANLQPRYCHAPLLGALAAISVNHAGVKSDDRGRCRGSALCYRAR